jgi:tetratricopeptide (TPR) repeat protein/TolB-like protein
VLDFGLAKVSPLKIDGIQGTPCTTASTLEAGKMVGTPVYMAPEQILAKEVDQRSDIYGTGVLLFEMLTGQLPFKGDNLMELALAVLTKPAPEVTAIDPTLPVELNSLVGRAIAKAPEDRYSSAGELRQEIGRVLAEITGTGEAAAGTTQEERTTVPPSHAWPWRRHKTVMLSAAVGLAILAALMFYWNPWRARKTAPIPARSQIVVVLPFANLSGDPSKEHICAGISTSLTIALARLSGVRTISSSVVDDYVRKYGRNPTRIAKDLDATLVVDGGVQESGGRLRIIASLVRPDGSIECPYEDTATLSEIFPLQARLAQGLGTHLASRLTEVSRQLLAKPLTTDEVAFEDYSRGREYMERRDVPGKLQLAVDAFRRAVARDPKFAAAYAALGEASWLLYFQTRQQPWVDRAKEAILEALRLDPQQSEVRLSLAQLLKGTGRTDEALAELRRVVAVQPDNDDAHRLMGQILSDRAQVDAAIIEFNEAIRLRPGFWTNYMSLATAYFKAGRLQEAARSYLRVTELQPDNAWAFGNLGVTYMELGANRRAIESLEKSLAITPDAYTFANLGTVRYWQGDFEGAARATQDAIKLLPDEAWIHRNLGDIYARLGKRQQAEASYEEAVRLSERLLRVNPKDGYARAKLALYQAKLGRLQEAKRNVEEALKLAPDDKDVLYSKAVVHCLTGETELAIAALRSALEHGYSRFDMKKDDDLSLLRPLPAYNKLLSEEP